MKKIISLGLACALAVSPLSCNCAFANENIVASKVSTTNDENSKSKVAEETLNKLAKKLKKANKEELEALAEKLKKVNKEDLNNLLEQSAKKKTETKQLRSDSSKLKSKLRTYFWCSFVAGIFGALSIFSVFFSPSLSGFFSVPTTILGWIANIAGVCI